MKNATRRLENPWVLRIGTQVLPLQPTERACPGSIAAELFDAHKGIVCLAGALAGDIAYEVVVELVDTV